MADERWQRLRRLLTELIDGYAGKIEYGNLRLEIYDGNTGDGVVSGRIALAYETPGGSTNQFGITYEGAEFQMLDASAEQILELHQPEEVAERVEHQVQGIPEYRLKRLRQDIDQWASAGSSRRHMLEELNRMMRMQTEFRGGSLTLDELTDACRYVQQITAAQEG